jgi:hypothetical protein
MGKCKEPNCPVKRAQFGYEGKQKEFCSKHKKKGMIDLVHKKCFCGKNTPYFGLEGDKATHCSECKESTMIDVKHLKCFCKKSSPSFGFEGAKNPTHCSICKEENMIDLKHSKCFCGKKTPYFGLEGDKATHCSECKEENMIDVVHQICFCGKKTPYFGLEGDKATHCNECKEENMINVISKKCFCGKKIPLFGFKDGKATHCKECKEENMINVGSPKCFCGLKTPNFGFKGEKATHCYDCKESLMIDVKHPKCKVEFCTILANKKYEGYCAYCYGNLFPDDPKIKNFKTKERLVVDYIKEQYKNYDWIFDKTILDGCSNRRPDIYLDLGYQILIIEVDENQHRQYEDICENKRMMILSQDVNHRPIIFIRFNPDKYINEENKNVPSCFSITKNGALKVNVKKNWNHRLEILKDNIDYWIEKETNKTIELVQLFYDEV